MIVARYAVSTAVAAAVRAVSALQNEYVKLLKQASLLFNGRNKNTM
jgi:hypothetical protein